MALSSPHLRIGAWHVPAWLLAAAYVLVFLALDWVSFIRPYQGLNITPWNPQPALAIALLLRRPGWLGLVWLSLFAADLVVRGWPDKLLVTLAATWTLALSYAVIARVLARRWQAPLLLGTQRDLAWFTGTAVVGALLSGTLYVSVMAAGGVGPEGALTVAIARYWVGDAVGVVVMLPMLLAWIDARRRVELLAALRMPSWWAVAGLIGALLALLVLVRDGHEPFKFFYLLFLPVIWAAARLGLAGAVLSAALTQVGLIAALQGGSNPDLTVFELQVLMTALTMTGLLLGVAVDERRSAEQQLRGSLRMAAAGQMAAALAHELSQPLTALNGYAQATRLLAAAQDGTPQARLARLTEVAQRMADDALRASSVVKRLRDFFRSGSTQLQRVPVTALLAEALAAAQRRAATQDIALRTAGAGQAEVLVDPVQIAVVLRNLLDNAMDAAAAAPAPRQVDLQVARQPTELQLTVRDSGRGVSAERAQQLFDPGASDKASGMGIGLSICRAIVEAHGGRLWCEPGRAGVFCLTLPVADREANDTDHAP